MRQPQKLPLDRLYRILPGEIRRNSQQISFHDGIGVIVGIDGSFFRLLDLSSSPFLLEDYRLGMVMRGSLRGIINLRERVVTAGTIVFITPGTIVEPLEVSDDFLLEGMGLPAEKFHLAHGGRLPELFDGRMTDGRMTVSAECFATIGRMFALLLELMEQTPLPMETVYGVVTAITHYYSLLFGERTAQPDSSHSSEIFNRFLRLVNLYSRREHRLSFYAGELCITSRYLGTVVQTVSGVNAKEWIDRAVISSAKVMLRHSDRQTTEIADELNFPNTSFFCKYFKRITGLTPMQYRNLKDT